MPQRTVGAIAGMLLARTLTPDPRADRSQSAGRPRQSQRSNPQPVATVRSWLLKNSAPGLDFMQADDTNNASVPAKAGLASGDGSASLGLWPEQHSGPVVRHPDLGNLHAERLQLSEMPRHRFFPNVSTQEKRGRG